MKDFTKTQKQGRAVSLKCNKCSTIVKAFGIEPGDSCAGTPARNDSAEGGLGRSAPMSTCEGTYMPFDGREADALKRRSDGAS